MNYFVRIKDEHTDHALRSVVDALNQIQQQKATTGQVAAVAAAIPSVNQIQQQLQAGGTAPLNLTGLPGAAPSATIGTHAQRLATTPNVGSIWGETDRTSIYMGELISGAATWVWFAGNYIDAIANRPADLGTNDVGFLFTDSTTNVQTQYTWLGAAWVTIGGFLQLVADGATNTTTPVFTIEHRTTGTPAASYGGGLNSTLDSSTNVERIASQLATRWTTATNASETASWTVLLRSAGATIADFFSVLVTGIRFKVGNFFGIFVHANTADRTYTFPDKNVTFDYGTFTPSLTNQANVTGSTAYQCQYMRLGQVVTVSGDIDINPTLTATITTVYMTLPIASVFALTSNLGGVCFAQNFAGMGSSIEALNIAGPTGVANFSFVSTSTSNEHMTFTFTYLLI